MALIRKSTGVRSDDPAPKARKQQAGFTLVELCIALTIAVISTLGLMGSMLSGSKLQQQTQEYGRANRAIQQVHETLRNGDLDDRIAEYKADPVFALGPITVAVSFPAQNLIDLLGTPIPVDWRYQDTDNDGDVDLVAGVADGPSLVPVEVLTTWTGGQMSSSFMVTEK
ncbi:MAG: prepilin-type N-terminal cleavage/methylation domain-containing protein [Planctomycetota bacterium]|jgi:prepilin-type N-terminal cleavage/methylation domain-containing protein